MRCEQQSPILLRWGESTPVATHEGSGGVGGLISEESHHNGGVWLDGYFYAFDAKHNVAPPTTLSALATEPFAAEYWYSPCGKIIEPAVLASYTHFASRPNSRRRNRNCIITGDRLITIPTRTVGPPGPVEESGGPNLYSFASTGPELLFLTVRVGCKRRMDDCWPKEATSGADKNISTSQTSSYTYLGEGKDFVGWQAECMAQLSLSASGSG